MQSHRINEILELIKPYWLKHQDLDLLTLLKHIATESGFDGPIDTLTDEVIIYHLKMDQTDKDEMIPGIAKDCEDDFQSALLKARGLL
ncbi:YihD family protein [Psychromonas sp. 14N.309.X.WAT.B.A12]|uniref:YihD family protein n=1 Tax=unclassified Psychromonas TaxID=2614957 RepID=UPI0025B0E158|nr:YihD family protein [Psychromonas sp. 14N.309.X.WAT.B.A12]MDN2664771.1 YihD family protein [Psychromonas sp. 14N.309.X.WAT.B.A12]